MNKIQKLQPPYLSLKKYFSDCWQTEQVLENSKSLQISISMSNHSLTLDCQYFQIFYFGSKAASNIDEQHSDKGAS